MLTHPARGQGILSARFPPAVVPRSCWLLGWAAAMPAGLAALIAAPVSASPHLLYLGLAVVGCAYGGVWAANAGTVVLLHPPLPL